MSNTYNDIHTHAYIQIYSKKTSKRIRDQEATSRNSTID